MSVKRIISAAMARSRSATACRQGNGSRTKIGSAPANRATCKMHKPIEPVVLCLQGRTAEYAAVRIRPGTTGRALAALGEAWRRFYPGRPFEYSFFDEDVARMYAAERRSGGMYGAGAGLSLLLSALVQAGVRIYSNATTITSSSCVIPEEQVEAAERAIGKAFRIAGDRRA